MLDKLKQIICNLINAEKLKILRKSCGTLFPLSLMKIPSKLRDRFHDA